MAEPQTIAAVQMNVDLADKESNLRRMLFFLEQTAGEGAKLTVFPECALTGYCFDSLEEARPYAEPIPGPSTERMAAACKRLNCHVVYGLLEADGKKVFNAAVLVGPKGVVGSYRKVHLPFLGIDRFTTPGDRPFAVHNAGGMKIGMNICYDGSFPEAARVMTLDGADLIVLPTNWPPGSECMASCAVNTRAMENQIYYLACNRVGTERGFRFIGMSKISAPGGSTIAEALHENEAILYAQVDVDKARNKHLVRVPKLHEIDRIKDRRPEMYSRLVEPK
ncbi:MAG TPA: carbon-nitrogen hydrolase family protein [Pirellulaceae bacterium]|nr:carbon-nitrogen hydrolase family protein [Pirellulaceae bacterium]